LLKGKKEMVAASKDDTAERVHEKTQDLLELTEKVDEIKVQSLLRVSPYSHTHIQSRINDRGSSMTDTTPIVRMKNSIELLEKSNKQLEVEIGVLRYYPPRFPTDTIHGGIR
jgi:hypothetical protein